MLIFKHKNSVFHFYSTLPNGGLLSGLFCKARCPVVVVHRKNVAHESWVGKRYCGKIVGGSGEAWGEFNYLKNEMSFYHDIKNMFFPHF